MIKNQRKTRLFKTKLKVTRFHSYCREASTKEEFCKVPRKRYADIGKAADPELTSKLYNQCMKSENPSVHICKKIPKTFPKKGFARKTHKQIKRLLKKLKKKAKRRKSHKKIRKGKKGKKKSRKGKKRGRKSKSKNKLEV